MRKLDFLRNKLAKCATYEEVASISLPDAFRHRGDVVQPKILCVDESRDGLDIWVCHGENKSPEAFHLMPRKEYQYFMDTVKI